jgi:hypothetical protein
MRLRCLQSWAESGVLENQPRAHRGLPCRPQRRHRGTVHAETARALHAAVGRRTRDSSDQPHSIALPLLLDLVFAARMPPTIAAGRRAAPPAVKQLRRVFSADAREARCSSKGTADSLCHTHCPVIGTPARRTPRLKKIHLASTLKGPLSRSRGCRPRRR